ncbi:hypothetical protein HBI82_033240 [Parastagonospora nodorum]|nr:hypothetical protein HBH51_022880 [Parastagonospora nodorum]KAH4921091.1 hypothetical protein HBI79_189360 [Parastagonospora nodorum]KAH4969713.1 hypothetical protein HBI78_052730 [Parastagonospora nodorum]KAH5314324.1 hypothetical protein HBI11_082240 [Parastagonospora nodorum]KAH5330270.1 hypothetical protein HBI50_064760 [Parastagonospora nodorum]
MALPKTKAVTFTTSAPEVRRVPDYMGSWAVGELDECVSDTIRARGRALADESYAMAEAMEAKEGQTSSQHATYRPGPTPGLRSCIRGHNGATGAKHKIVFQFSQPALVTQAVAGFSSEIRRKPVPARAMSSIQTPQLAIRPRLLRPATNHLFRGFLNAEEVASGKDDMRERRASLHAFEVLATKGLHGMKKYGLKAVKMAEKRK